MNNPTSLQKQSPILPHCHSIYKQRDSLAILYGFCCANNSFCNTSDKTKYNIILNDIFIIVLLSRLLQTQIILNKKGCFETASFIL